MHAHPAGLAAGSLRVITELHGRMDDVTKLQRDRQPAILPWKARERDASLAALSGSFESGKRIVANRFSLSRNVSLRDRNFIFR